MHIGKTCIWSHHHHTVFFLFIWVHGSKYQLMHFASASRLVVWLRLHPFAIHLQSHAYRSVSSNNQMHQLICPDMIRIYIGQYTPVVIEGPHLKPKVSIFYFLLQWKDYDERLCASIPKTPNKNTSSWKGNTNIPPVAWGLFFKVR